MVAIVTKFLGPTNTKPARIKATAGGSSHTVGYHSEDRPWEAAVKGLCEKLGWKGELVCGHTPKGRVYVFYHQGETFST